MARAARASSGRRDDSATGELCSTSSSAGLERVFHRFDEDGDGKVSPAELCSRMNSVGLELSLEDATEVVDSADFDGDGLLGMDEFVRLMSEAQEEEDKEREMREAFGVYEMSGRGYITAASLRTALGRLGNSSGIEDCKAMIRRFDLDGDGVISFDEFKAMLAC
ncbi:unnamed protein product [Spirodela intermedia]|uniref:EF-hand domain-containing protein n=1 Tax=Spirodela intermedia TaxID=51605 RepID=A0A7I8IBM5_SPIIN|nr:unnamed protein product [Spirodela intermedia]CAA6654733.1 unnamed protein product [Spirodela intermedia]